MTERFDGIGQDLRRELVAAFPGYVAAKLGEIGVEFDRFAVVVAAARAQLDAELAALLAQEPAQQREVPLELFRRALEDISDALAESNIPPVDRGPGDEAAMPGDVYGLAPASSQELGEAAWRANLAWGIAKAEEVAGVVPVPPQAEAADTREGVVYVAIVAGDRMDRSELGRAVTAAGYEATVWRNPGAVEQGLRRDPVEHVVLELAHPAAFDIAEMVITAGRKLLAFAPDGDDALIARATAVGIAHPTSRTDLLATLVQRIKR